MSTRSVRARLTFWYTLVLSCGLVLLSLTIWLILRHALYSDLRASLIGSSGGFATNVAAESSESYFSLAREASEFSSSMTQPHLVAVYNKSGVAQYASKGLEKRPPLAPDRNPVELILGNEHYLAIMQSVTLPQGGYDLLIAMPSGSIDAVIRRVGLALLIVVPLFISGGLLGGLWLSREALAPVDAITVRARATGLDNLADRLPVPQTGDELQRLTETWNEMLTRLQTAVGKVSQFTADASHELRTPIAIVRLAAESALKKGRSELEYREALQRIRHECENMGRLLDDLLFLARSDAGQGTRSWEMIHMDELVRAACLDLQPLAERKGIKLRTELAAHGASVAGDPAALRRATLILLDNAIKYSPGGSLVTIAAAPAADQLCIRVIDSGEGIPADLQPRVFERFFRADASRSKDSGGFGLGLAIARSILQQHAGNVLLERSSRQGSVFTMSLPLAT